MFSSIRTHVLQYEDTYIRHIIRTSCRAAPCRDCSAKVCPDPHPHRSHTPQPLGALAEAHSLQRQRLAALALARESSSSSLSAPPRLWRLQWLQEEPLAGVRAEQQQLSPSRPAAPGQHVSICQHTSAAASFASCFISSAYVSSCVSIRRNICLLRRVLSHPPAVSALLRKHDSTCS
jgi:hypothetical protein